VAPVRLGATERVGRSRGARELQLGAASRSCRRPPPSARWKLQRGLEAGNEPWTHTTVIDDTSYWGVRPPWWQVSDFRSVSGGLVHAVYMRDFDDPGADIKRRWLLRPAFELTLLTAVATLAGTLLFGAQKAAGLSWVDGAARSVVPLHVHPWINRLMTEITSLGGEIYLLLAFSGLALWSYRTRGNRWARFFSLVMVGALALDNLVKPLVGRPRPILDQLVGARGASFPSGHATATTALLLALGYYLASGRAPGVRKWIWATALLGSVLMAVTRVYLGVHWPTDAIAGIVFGAAWTVMCARSQEVTNGVRVALRAPRRWTPRARLVLTILALGGFAL
jgi:membrane-associated phospholipid phosphatase